MKIHRNKFKDWLFAHKIPIIIISLSLLILAAGATTALILLNQPEPEEPVAELPEESAPEPEPPKYYSNLSGRQVEDSAGINSATTCIMIENSPEARPQSGLPQAGVIFEAIAEGGITRFLAIYQDEKPNYIGPVRSVRPYYVEWLRPFNCSIAHVGGSDEALKMIRNNPNYRDIDQFFNGNYYWRTSDRYAPHNVYTSFEKLDVLNASKGYLTSDFSGFPRAEIGAGIKSDEKTLHASKITIKISSQVFNVVYDYSSATNSYLRSHADGKPHMDKAADGTLTQNSPNVVIAITVDERPSTTEVGRENIITSGNGKATVFQDGVVIEGTWQKLSAESQIEFYDADGKPLELNPGQTWITALPRLSGSVSWQ
jgi:hypothetical protein